MYLRQVQHYLYNSYLMHNIFTQFNHFINGWINILNDTATCLTYRQFTINSLYFSTVALLSITIIFIWCAFKSTFLFVLLSLSLLISFDLKGHRLKLRFTKQCQVHHNIAPNTYLMFKVEFFLTFLRDVLAYLENKNLLIFRFNKQKIVCKIMLDSITVI